MTIDASEISEILKSETKDLGDNPKVSEVGTVLTVGDGIAKWYGLDKCSSWRNGRISGKVKGALNLEVLRQRRCSYF